jgi:hypothetical protein
MTPALQFGRQLRTALRLALACALIVALVPAAAQAASAKGKTATTKAKTTKKYPSAAACAHPKTKAGKKACAARAKAVAAAARAKKTVKIVRRPVATRPVSTRPSSGTTTTTPAPSSTTTTTTTAPVATTSSTAPITPTNAAIGTSTTRLYSSSSAFNTPVGASPRIASNSAAMVSASLLNYRSSANFANSDDWGISIVNAKSSDPLRSISVASWGYGADIAQPAVRIPNGAQPTSGSDHHLVVLDGGTEMDMWVGYENADGSWGAGARAATSTTGNGIAGPVSGNAAGFALAAGVIRPEEIAAGHIDHALVFTSPYVRNSYVAPAVHGDGRQTDPNAMPMGTHIQLDPSFDISSLSRTQKVIAQAMKDYGAFLVDSSGSLAIRGEASIGRASTGGPSDIWSPVGVTNSNLQSIPWDHMRVVLPS